MAQSGNRLFHRSGDNDNNKPSVTGFHPFVKTSTTNAKTPLELTLSKKIAIDVINSVKVQN